MYGLEAIEAHNGWAIAVVGVTIVFTGLVLLSFFISQLHRIIELIDNPPKRKPKTKKKAKEKEKQSLRVFNDTEKEAAKQFRLLVRTLEDHFALPRLLHLAQISGLEHSHSRLNLLLESGIIKPDADGYFTWDLTVYRQTVDKEDKDK